MSTKLYPLNEALKFLGWNPNKEGEDDFFKPICKCGEPTKIAMILLVHEYCWCKKCKVAIHRNAQITHDWDIENVDDSLFELLTC